MFILLKFNVWLQWKDNRIESQNLKEDYFQNQISDDVAMSLWIPQPVFSNSYFRSRIQYNPTASFLMLIRNSTSHEAPTSQMDEARVFETELIMKTIHLLEFRCDFDLKYFPFDYQTCYVQVCNSCIDILNLKYYLGP